MYLLCRLEGELISHDTWYIATYSRSLQGVLLIRGLGAHVDAPGGGLQVPRGKDRRIYVIHTPIENRMVSNKRSLKYVAPSERSTQTYQSGPCMQITQHVAPSIQRVILQG